MNREFDLLTFIVHKNDMNASNSPKIIPEPMPIEANRAYKLINFDNKIKDKPINVEILKENKINLQKNNKMNYPQTCKPEKSNVAQFANNVTDNIDINSLLGILKCNNILPNNFNTKPNNNFYAFNNRQNFGQGSRNDSLSMNNSKSRNNSLEYLNSRESSLEMLNGSRESSIEIPHNRYNNQQNLMQQQKMISSNNLYNNNNSQNSKNNLLGYLGNNNNYDILKKNKRNFTQVQSRAEPVNFASNLVKRNPQSRQPFANDNRLMKVLDTGNVNNNQPGNLMSQQQLIDINNRKTYLQKCVTNIKMQPNFTNQNNMPLTQGVKQILDYPVRSNNNQNNNQNYYNHNIKSNVGNKMLKVNNNSVNSRSTLSHLVNTNKNGSSNNNIDWSQLNSNGNKMSLNNQNNENLNNKFKNKKYVPKGNKKQNTKNVPQQQRVNQNSMMFNFIERDFNNQGLF